MRLIFKQRFFSWFDSYDIYNESGETVYTVRGELAWGHQLRIYDAYGNEVGLIKEKILTFLPKFEMYSAGQYLGCVTKKISFFAQKFDVDFNGWRVVGDFFGYNYSIMDPSYKVIATVSKELFNFTDTYSINVPYSSDAAYAVMLVLAIDAEKCSNN